MLKSVLDTCKPRPEIVAGTFNPEVFTASLSPILESYRDGTGNIDRLYTDAELFFKEATYPTQGLRRTLSEVFSRIAGDMTVPAIHRLETSFGGGKTHTLIACTHIAFKGTELHHVVDNILEPELLPVPCSVDVVAVAGDEIPVHKPKGDALVPYTLWGEIAHQIGGEPLYQELGAEATSHAAPGKSYFEKVFSGRKVLIMLDELAQYAARLEAARPDGASQLAAFLMSLHGYARNNPGVSIVLTLASASDAFGRQTERLANLISEVRGEQVSHDDALGIGEEAVKSVASVVARDADQITPVQATEISSVLAKRLFRSIDREAAEKAAEAYLGMYQRNLNYLPEEASNEGYKERIVANYPFHPTLVDFLNKKLASAENFQGTRGVLRVLSLAVRSLWKDEKEKQLLVPMIHVSHLNLRSERVVNELLGRTGSSDLHFIINADIGSVDTDTLEGSKSNAQLADEKNRHPEGYPLYEYTWKTVFLHSLVGSEEGIQSKIFGLTESEAMLAVSFPTLTPAQVDIALEEINESAFYLRYEQGKYFASSQPTINSVLARIRRGLRMKQVKELLEATARKVITGGFGFHVEYDVSLPEHLPDGKGIPVVGIISPTAESIDVEAMITTKGPNNPREEQNLIFLLVPETVEVKGKGDIIQIDLLQNTNARSSEVLQSLERIALQVMAMRELAARPQNYGINPSRLTEEDFQKRRGEREQALLTEVSRAYTTLYYPSMSGLVVSKEIRSSVGEGGLPFVKLIREMLIEEGELLTAKNISQPNLENLSQFFFAQGDTITFKKLRENFFCIRNWPVLENDKVLEQIVRAGVQKNVWNVFRLNDNDSVKPEAFYDEDNLIPMSVNLLEEGFSLITPQGAKQRGWTETDQVDLLKVQQEVIHSVASMGVTTVEQIAEQVTEKYGEITEQALEETLGSSIRDKQFFVYRGKPDQRERPELIHGSSGALYTTRPGDVLISMEEASNRGWISNGPSELLLEGKEGIDKLLPLLHRLGSIYNRGARSTVKLMEFVDLELPDGGTLHLELNDVTPESMKSLGELFEVLAGVVERGKMTEAALEIDDPDEECPFIQELKNE